MSLRTKYNKRWRKDHQKHIKEYAKSYRIKHRKEIQEYEKRYGKQYRKGHLEELKVYNKNYRKKHSKEATLYREKYRSRRLFLKKNMDSEKKAKAMLAAKRQQCRIRNIPFNLVLSDISPLPKFCPVLGIKLRIHNQVIKNNSPTLDRINPKRGYTKGNVKVISALANRLKSNGTVEQIKAVLKYMKKERQ